MNKRRTYSVVGRNFTNMKKYLLLILASILSISGYAIQTDNGTGATKSGSTWYSTIVSQQYDIQDGNNLDIYFSYPSNQVKFEK